jgi:hypothetical protein
MMPDVCKWRYNFVEGFKDNLGRRILQQVSKQVIVIPGSTPDLATIYRILKCRLFLRSSFVFTLLLEVHEEAAVSFRLIALFRYCTDELTATNQRADFLKKVIIN